MPAAGFPDNQPDTPPQHLDTTADRTTIGNGMNSLRQGAEPRPDTILPNGDEHHVPLLSSMPAAECEGADIAELDWEGEETGGAGGLLRPTATQPVLLGDLSSGDENERENDFLDPDYDPEVDSEDDIVSDFGLGHNVVLRLAIEADNDSDDDSHPEAPNNLVSGLLGRIGLRAVLPGGARRVAR